MSWREMRELVRKDAARYTHTVGKELAVGGPLGTAYALLGSQGFVGTFVYRVAHELQQREPRGTGTALKVGRVAVVGIRKVVEVTANVSIDPTATIGGGLYIGHWGAFMGPGTMGENCSISQNVTLGRNPATGVRPRIGDRVWIGPGAVVYGDIDVGNDVAIGANAVVNKSLPDRAVAAGLPARPVSFTGSFDMNPYDGAETDPSRIASLAARDAELQARQGRAA
jgi:serine acetyltransferase